MLSLWGEDVVHLIFQLKRIAATILTTLITVTGATEPHRFYCAEGNAQIVYTDPIDVAVACDAVTDTRNFLRLYHLKSEEEIRIQIVADLPEEMPLHLLGYYDDGQDQVYVLSRAACITKDVEMFGLPLDQALYKSFLVHETSHAIASRNFSVQATLVPHEYIAYVTQLATMPTALRERIEANFPGSGFNEIKQISATFFLLSPELFAVKAYRHFQRQKNATALMRRLLDEPSPAEH